MTKKKVNNSNNIRSKEQTNNGNTNKLTNKTIDKLSI